MISPADLLLAASGLGVLYLAMAGLLATRLSRRDARQPSRFPNVTVLKPLHGAESDLRENLRSFVEQDYPGEVQIVFGVQRPDDPAIRVVRELRDRYPERDLSLIADARLYGTNRKVSNLINMSIAIRHDVVVLADSDMRVRPDYLRGVVGELERPGVGAVTCPYNGLPNGSFWSRLSAMSIDTHFLPSVAMAEGLDIGHPCMGSTIALRRATLDRIGGFRALANELADDHELGARVRALGLEVAMTPFTVGHVCHERSWPELLAHELRWLRTVRQVAPAGHLGSILTHPVPFALLALLVEPSGVALAAVALAVSARLGLCLAVERAFGLKPQPLWLVPARDLLSFGMFVASYLVRNVSWRGHRYQVSSGGALLTKPRPDPL